MLALCNKVDVTASLALISCSLPYNDTNPSLIKDIDLATEMPAAAKFVNEFELEDEERSPLPWLSFVEVSKVAFIVTLCVVSAIYF